MAALTLSCLEATDCRMRIEPAQTRFSISFPLLCGLQPRRAHDVRWLSEAADVRRGCSAVTAVLAWPESCFFLIHAYLALPACHTSSDHPARRGIIPSRAVRYARSRKRLTIQQPCTKTRWPVPGSVATRLFLHIPLPFPPPPLRCSVSSQLRPQRQCTPTSLVLLSVSPTSTCSSSVSVV